MTLQSTTPTSSSTEIPDGQAFASLAMLILHLVIITCALGYARADVMRRAVGWELALGGPDLPAMSRATAGLSSMPTPRELRLEAPADRSRLVRAL